MVTKGDFPQLERNNILKNRKICEETGLEHFTFEVVTDKSISLVTSKKLRELLVPEDYSTKSGALYKSRTLQYFHVPTVSSGSLMLLFIGRALDGLAST